MAYLRDQAAAASAEDLLGLHTYFVTDIESKLNALSLAQIAIAISRRQGPRPCPPGVRVTRPALLTRFSDAPSGRRANGPDAATARNLIEAALAKARTSIDAQALLLVEQAQLFLTANEVDKSRKNLAEAQAFLDRLPGIEPVLHSSFYRVSANADKVGPARHD